MQSRFVRLGIPVVMLLLFLAVMTSDWLLKKPFSDHDDVQLRIADLREAVLAEQWPEADAGWDKLQIAWKLVSARVQFSAERSEMEGLSFALARLQGAILAQDKSDALIELAEAEEHWRDLGR